jgi:AraC family transcriptional regulator, regulatory protein of adaptative response / methylated-DNA-[protein]-cysteine methyltransferase
MQNDYDRIARAIMFLHEHVSAQPSLADVAAHVGLSESQMQRVFTRWAGISPKRFLQFLTAGHAENLLRNGRPVLEAAYEAGLSAPSRLYDLMISATAATPGDHRALGEGLTIRYGVHDSPFGPAFIAQTDRGICQLGFLGDPGEEHELAGLRSKWPRATLQRNHAATTHIARAVFDNAENGPIPVHLKGTNFQLQVWHALLRVPPGEVTTYDALAQDIGAPTSHRAVGTAVGRNPVAFLIPCHRVIRKTGAIGDYHWGGSTRKQALLAWEAAQLSA